MQKKEKDISLDEYIAIAKGDIIIYSVVALIICAPLLYGFIKTKVVLFIIFGLVPFLFSVQRVQTYFNLKKIRQYLIDNKIIDKLGKIDFYNDQYYFLTENYMVIFQNKKVSAFKYSDIKEMYKTTKIRAKEYSTVEEYLNIVTQDNEVYRVLTFTISLVQEEFKDISDYLLNKNPKIKVKDSNTNMKVRITGGK